DEPTGDGTPARAEGAVAVAQQYADRVRPDVEIGGVGHEIEFAVPVEVASSHAAGAPQPQVEGGQVGPVPLPQQDLAADDEVGLAVAVEVARERRPPATCWGVAPDLEGAVAV